MYTVYWTETVRPYDSASVEMTTLLDTFDTPLEARAPCSREFEDNQLGEALKFCEDLRKDRRAGAPISMVTMASEDINSVGQAGVDSVVDGKTPDGEAYTWSKAGRAGRMRPKDYLPRNS